MSAKLQNSIIYNINNAIQVIQKEINQIENKTVFSVLSWILALDENLSWGCGGKPREGHRRGFLS